MPDIFKREKPSPPIDGECCESGSCTPCVWDKYYAKLKVWRLEQVEIKEHIAKSSLNNGHKD
jgi:hypothetical protein